MPRKSRGGPADAKPGKAYGQRTDMNVQRVQTPPSQQYGQGAQLEAAQRAIPLPNNAAAGAPAPAPVDPPIPGSSPLDAPSARPQEHVSTGLPIGQGMGPEAMSGYMGDDTGIQLRALYQQFPNQDLADLIEVFEANRG